MFDFIKNWYNLYPSLEVFLEHKLTHVFVGIFGGVLISIIFSGVVAIGVVSIAAIGKEIADHFKSLPEYRPPLSAHVLDIIITILGGFIGVGISLL